MRHECLLKTKNIEKVLLERNMRGIRRPTSTAISSGSWTARPASSSPPMDGRCSRLEHLLANPLSGSGTSMPSLWERCAPGCCQWQWRTQVPTRTCEATLMPRTEPLAHHSQVYQHLRKRRNRPTCHSIQHMVQGFYGIEGDRG